MKPLTTLHYNPSPVSPEPEKTGKGIGKHLLHVKKLLKEPPLRNFRARIKWQLPDYQ